MAFLKPGAEPIKCCPGVGGICQIRAIPLVVADILPRTVVRRRVLDPPIHQFSMALVEGVEQVIGRAEYRYIPIDEWMEPSRRAAHHTDSGSSIWKINEIMLESANVSIEKLSAGAHDRML